MGVDIILQKLSNIISAKRGKTVAFYQLLIYKNSAKDDSSCLVYYAKNTKSGFYTKDSLFYTYGQTLNIALAEMRKKIKEKEVLGYINDGVYEVENDKTKIQKTLNLIKDKYNFYEEEIITFGRILRNGRLNNAKCCKKYFTNIFIMIFM
jgi:hypothetical protein